MTTKVSVFVEYSKTKKTRTSRYFFETELGTCALEDREHGNYRYHQSDRDWREIEMKDVPIAIREEFRESGIYPSAENKAKREKERAIRERIAREREEKARQEAENIATPITNVSADELIAFILSAWRQYKGEADGVELHEKGVRLSIKRAYDGDGKCYQNMKISNPGWGLSFKVSSPIDYKWDGEKHIRQVKDIAPALDGPFRFVFAVCQAGAHIKNKGIVQALAKKSNIPGIKTLKENGFDISNKDLQSLDLKTLEGIKNLFNTYKA
ncbi:hypothetical protein HQ40_02105 [Porphyromonas gulae]|uniref:hypothetical protein n=1 Tax=Porphyromonas gulae TaxID=111105 RepID=UPI00052C9FCA|nr:hypothetical protein [Porphyromonas gulae]KGN76913.1 hypothetical protein HQ40_02105 [Porphyromonas gulae]